MDSYDHLYNEDGKPYSPAELAQFAVQSLEWEFHSEWLWKFHEHLGRGQVCGSDDCWCEAA
jgi:hypothetical protein